MGITNAERKWREEQIAEIRDSTEMDGDQAHADQVARASAGINPDEMSDQTRRITASPPSNEAGSVPWTESTPVAGRTRTKERVFFRDVKPYSAPDTLDQLSGPAGGVIELPHSVLWAPGGGRVDLDEPGGTAMAYQAVLTEGTIEDQVHVLNHGRLVAVWLELMLPRRVRVLWQDQFPELPREPTVP